MGIDHVVHAVQLIGERLVHLRRLDRGGVGVDQLLPVADAGVDVRGHVLGMRRRRRDLGVAVGGIKALRRGRRIVVEVDQVVRHARMLRQALGDRFEDRRALELLGVGFVVRRRRRVQRDGVGDLRLVVVGVFRRQRLHGLQECADALAMAELVVIDVHDGKGVDVVPLALGLGAGGFRFLDGGKPERQVGSRDREVRIVQERECDAPMGDGAVRVGLQSLLEDLLRRAVPERVLIAHRAVDPPLRDLVARGLEADVAELLVDVALRDERLRRRECKCRNADAGC